MFAQPTTAGARTDGAQIDWDAGIRAHIPALRAWTRRQLGGDEGLDDVLQEVALAAVRSGNPPVEPAKILPWLKAVARHKVADHWRKLGRDRRLRACLATEDATTAPSPSQWVLDVDRLDSVREALATLPPEEREILVSKYAEGRSCAQIAKRRNLTPKALEYRLTKARDRMRALLGGQAPANSNPP